MKYTKGEWLLTGATPNQINVSGNDGTRIATVWRITPTEMKNNASLIAAAPKMYEALKAIRIEKCEHCEGTGKEPKTDDDACSDCGGYGRVIVSVYPGDIDIVLATVEAV